MKNINDFSKEELFSMIYKLCIKEIKDTNHNSILVFIVRKDQANNTFKYALMLDDRYVLNKKTLEFVYEPLPSSRTEDFLKNTRFDSIEECYNCFKKYYDLHIKTKEG